MKISEKQIMRLISIAEQVLAKELINEEGFKHLRIFLNQIQDQQSEELKIIE